MFWYYVTALARRTWDAEVVASIGYSALNNNKQNQPKTNSTSKLNQYFFQYNTKLIIVINKQLRKEYKTA